MKLKNRKTGEISELKVTINGNLTITKDDEIIAIYPSLAELNAEWEDYEEPDEIWYIDWKGDIRSADIGNGWYGEKQIGNYFATEEEAEKAVEKLKAWKRLKDNGLVVKKWSHTPDMNLTTGSFIKIEGFIPEVVKNMNDLELIFGGEE